MPTTTTFPNCTPCCGGGATVACCGNSLPTTLTVTVSNQTGDCTCFPSSFSITWNGSAWTTPNPPGTTFCGRTQAISFQCNPGGTSFTWTGAPAGCIFVTNQTVWTCDPFSISFTGVSISTCCTGSADFTITP